MLNKFMKYCPIPSLKNLRQIFYFHFPELEALIFLHACKYSMEAAKICMDTYHTTRTHVPEFFSKRDVFGKDVCGQMKTV